jgi:hypothetical protein
MLLSKTMRMFALMGLLVPVVSQSMETANAVVDAAIGVSSSSNGSAGQSRRAVRGSRGSMHRAPNYVRVNKASNTSWSDFSTLTKYGLMGAIALPAAVLSLAFVAKKAMGKPFPAVSLEKMSLWALFGGILGLVKGDEVIEEQEFYRKKARFYEYFRIKLCDKAQERAKNKSEFSAAYTSAIQATEKQPSKPLVKSTCTVNPAGQVNMTFGV